MGGSPWPRSASAASASGTRASTSSNRFPTVLRMPISAMVNLPSSEPTAAGTVQPEPEWGASEGDAEGGARLEDHGRHDDCRRAELPRRNRETEPELPVPLAER